MSCELDVRTLAGANPPPHLRRLEVPAGPLALALAEATASWPAIERVEVGAIDAVTAMALVGHLHVRCSIDGPHAEELPDGTPWDFFEQETERQLRSLSHMLPGLADQLGEVPPQRSDADSMALANMMLAWSTRCADAIEDNGARLLLQVLVDALGDACAALDGDDTGMDMLPRLVDAVALVYGTVAKSKTYGHFTPATSEAVIDAFEERAGEALHH